MDYSTPGFPAHHQLPELTQTHVHRVGDAIQPSHPLSSPFSSCLQSFTASESFPRSQFFTAGGQSIGASASVLPMNIQDWFPLQWTGWISLLSKGLSDVRGVKNYRCKKCPKFKWVNLKIEFVLWDNSWIRQHPIKLLEGCSEWLYKVKGFYWKKDGARELFTMKRNNYFGPGLLLSIEGMAIVF